MSDSEDFACKVDRSGCRRGEHPRQVFDESMCHVDAKSVDSEIDPEAQNVAKFSSNLWVVPVEIGLADIEQVEIPMSVLTASPHGNRRPKHRRGDQFVGGMSFSEQRVWRKPLDLQVTDVAISRLGGSTGTSTARALQTLSGLEEIDDLVMNHS